MGPGDEHQNQETSSSNYVVSVNGSYIITQYHPPKPTPKPKPKPYRAPPRRPPTGYQPYYPDGGGYICPPISSTPAPQPTPPPPAPFVDHRGAANNIQNDVHVLKDTIRLSPDPDHPLFHLLSFTFDATVDGSITIFYFAKEGSNGSLTPLYPEIYVPVKVTFERGHGQKFCQASGTGIDLSFFDTEELSKPTPKGNFVPLVILAQSGLPSRSKDKQPEAPLLVTSKFSHAQVTQAVLIKNNEDGQFKARTMKQTLWVNGVRYAMHDIYGIGTLDEATTSKDDSANDCVICLTEPKDTTVLPCMHLCMCSECAKAFRLHSNNCPICRQPIQQLLKIKIQKG